MACIKAREVILRNLKGFPCKLKVLARHLSKAGIRWKIGKEYLLIPYSYRIKDHYYDTPIQYNSKVFYGDLPRMIKLSEQKQVFHLQTVAGSAWYEEMGDTIIAIMDHLERWKAWQKGGIDYRA